MEKLFKILLIEDEIKLAKIIQEELIRVGYEVDLAMDGNQATVLFDANDYALIILDINLPYKSGLTLCKEFRASNKKVPILMLTAMGEIRDKIHAFDIGADDYLVKPFHFDELFARIKVLLKRTDQMQVDDNIEIEGLTSDFKTKTVTR